MDLYEQKSRSLPQKLLIMAVELALLYVAYRLLFGAWGLTFARWMGWPAAHDPARGAVLLAFDVVVILRITFMMLVFLERRIPVEEAIAVPLAFGAYFVGFALFALRATAPLGIGDAVGIALFALGSILNTGAELQRHRWKRHAENRGHLYRGGMFAWSMHINYFGDVLWVSGYAFVSHNPWAAVVPIALFSMFAFYNVPKLDRHLAEHYGAEFDEYARSTRKLVPFVY
jgi:protein-S-isoprenylcysteine O-methyltransferase Ste14